MSYLLRKIARQKWESSQELAESLEALQADAITSCLRTSGNTLSVWSSETNDWDHIGVKETLAALFSTLDGPNRIDVMFLPESAVNDNMIKIVETIGESPANDDINGRHRDLSELTYSSIGAVASLILNTIKEHENNTKRYNAKQVQALVKEHYEQGKLDGLLLSERWKEKLEI
jgi:hypothetical protein